MEILQWCLSMEQEQKSCYEVETVSLYLGDRVSGAPDGCEAIANVRIFFLLGRV